MARGYAIEARQATREWGFFVDGQETPVTLRADYLVSRGGRRFLAEVKTGALAPRADHAPTRRQLLEYHHAFDVDGVLLVNADADQIHEIAFPAPPSATQGPLPRVLWLLLGLAAGALVEALAAHYGIYSG